MKKKLTLFAITASSALMAQFPLADEWMLNTTGSLASYEYYPAAPPATISVNMTDSADVLTVCYDNDYVYIRANGLASYQMGPWEMNPNQPSAQLKTYRFTRSPQEETGAKEAQPFGGALGVAVNGVSLYGAGDARSYNSSNNMNDNMGDGLWNADAWVSEGATLDATGLGHPDGMGNYHYHATPIWLYAGSTTVHSPIIGWSLDGFPIYGPYGYTSPYDAGSAVTRMETGYELRTISDRSTLPGGGASTPPGPAINATFPLGTYQEDYEYTAIGHLDEYNGRWCVTPEFPDTIYAYFITQDGAGEPEYPYITGPEYFGQVNASEIGGAAGNVSIPSGVTCLDGTSSLQETSMIDITAYPNPTNGLVNISTDIIQSDLQLKNYLGQNVDFTFSTGVLDISDLPDGVYFLQVKRDDSIGLVKLIKN